MDEEIVKIVKEKVEVLYKVIMEKPLRVLGIFNDFFGEDNVDMQDYCTLTNLSIWINMEPISTYIPNSNIVGFTSSEWDMYKTYNITDLPKSLAIKVINSLSIDSICDKIGHIKFNNIFILVHFPHVRVTNEHNRFVDINHLWAKVKISYNGTMYGGFSLNRSEYSLLHLSSDYMHSHISCIPFSDFSLFQSPCTGSGPINATIMTLNRDYNEDMWNMFCLELSKYVTVESITGRPYHYLERLGTNSMDTGINEFYVYLDYHYFGFTLSRNCLKGFINYFIRLKELKFNYVNESFSIGMSFIEFIILISNEFIKWYNEQYNLGTVSATLTDLKNSKVLKECIINNGRIYYENEIRNINRYDQYVGKKVCMFKGKEVTVTITDITEVKNNNKSLIFNIDTALYILSIILKVLNYRYGRNKAIQKNGYVGTEVRYL